MIDHTKIHCKEEHLETQTSLAEATHYPNIGWIPDIKSQHGDPDHP